MSFGTPQALSKDVVTAVTTNETSYALRAADSGKSTFAVSGLTFPAQKSLTISHQTDKNGALRHLVRLDRTELDSTLVPATSSVYLVIVDPPSTAITNAILIEEVNKLIHFLVATATNGQVTQLLNQEV